MESTIPPLVVSASRSLGHYKWGSDCEAWKLVDNKDLSVKLEKMLPATEKVLHYHSFSQQFFYVLTGRAVFEIDEVILIVHVGEGLLIDAGRRHRIMNKEQDTPLEFLVCSQPSIEGDRQNLV